MQIQPNHEDIVNACKFAAADEFINKLPEKYSTIIGKTALNYLVDRSKDINCKSCAKKFTYNTFR